jgi:hypothetical protein
MPLGHDVVLEGVDELVTDDVVRLGQGRSVGQDDAALERLGEAARASPRTSWVTVVCWNSGLLP